MPKGVAALVPTVPLVILCESLNSYDDVPMGVLMTVKIASLMIDAIIELRSGQQHSNRS